MFILAADKFHTIPDISSSASTSSISCFQQVQNTCSNSLLKVYSSEYILFASYFDIGIIRTLFSPSWLIDGYLWCLEYIHKRLIDISDEILSDNHILSNHFKSLTISQLNNLNEENFYKYFKKIYFNEQITNNIIEKQYIMTTIFNSNKQRSILLNIPFKYSSKKSDYFFIQKRGRK
jgi:hypothetical protein